MNVAADVVTINHKINYDLKNRPTFHNTERSPSTWKQNMFVKMFVSLCLTSVSLPPHSVWETSPPNHRGAAVCHR